MYYFHLSALLPHELRRDIGAIQHIGSLPYILLKEDMPYIPLLAGLPGHGRCW